MPPIAVNILHPFVGIAVFMRIKKLHQGDSVFHRARNAGRLRQSLVVAPSA